MSLIKQITDQCPWCFLALPLFAVAIVIVHHMTTMAAIGQISASEAEIMHQIEEHAKILDSITKSVELRTSDRFRAEEMEEWIIRFKEENPHLKIPTLKPE